MRGGRGNNGGRRGPNPLTRSYESNGPDVKVRGTPQHIAEKYVQLARDAHSASDNVMAESYLQHAEHYYRIIAAAQAAQQQAYNLANGIPVAEAEQLEDEDEFEVAGADRFTFRTPQSFQQQGGYGGQGQNYGQQPYQQPQSFGTDPASADQPLVGDNPQPVGDSGQPLPYQQQPRGDRQQFGNRRFDDRGGRRFGRDRQFGGDRQGGDNRPQGDRNFGERGGGERQPFQPRPELPQGPADEQPGLPSFITAPSRIGAPEADSVPAPRGDETQTDAGFRPRRRRRGRSGGGEGQQAQDAGPAEE
jgi:hypothetical protein